MQEILQNIKILRTVKRKNNIDISLSPPPFFLTNKIEIYMSIYEGFGLMIDTRT